MNTIEMIPVEQLHHHPENPRLDLGDLTELAESIRANGVMQNLTVVRGHRMSKGEWVAAARAEGADKASAEGSYDPESAEVSDGYTVVIGNRRMEAAKMAGLAEVPCVVSDMDHRTQISSMLMENMQRADLTVYEQAQGFQMMMDLGFTPKEIGEKTGFGETTVRRRLKMAELDPKLLAAACEKKDRDRQITLFDFERLAQVDSIKERNKLLKDIGEREFSWNLNRALNVQAANKAWKTIHKKLHEANVAELNHDERYSGNYECNYNWQKDLGKMDPEKDFIPIDVKKLQSGEEQLFFYRDDTTLNFYTKAKKQPAKKPEKSKAELEREKEIAEAWKTITEDETRARQLRHDFVKDVGVNTKNSLWMLQWFMFAATVASVNYQSPRDELRELIGINDSVTWAERQQKAIDGVLKLKLEDYPSAILLFFECCSKDSFRYGSFKHQKPKYMKNPVLDAEYEWLCSLGYSMSEKEIELQDGTHQAYGPKEEQEA